MPTLLAQIFLMTMFVFSVAIKVCARRVGDVYKRQALCNEQKLSFAFFGQVEAGTLSRSKTIQGGVRADEVVKEDEHGNKVVGGSKRGKALLGLVPSLELLVKALNEVVGNIIVEAFHANMLYRCV